MGPTAYGSSIYPIKSNKKAHHGSPIRFDAANFRTSHENAREESCDQMDHPSQNTARQQERCHIRQRTFGGDQGVYQWPPLTACRLYLGIWRQDLRSSGLGTPEEIIHENQRLPIPQYF